MVKFCNISKEVRLGIRPGNYIVVSDISAKQMAKKVKMGSEFIIVQQGVDPMPPKKEKVWRKKR